MIRIRRIVWQFCNKPCTQNNVCQRCISDDTSKWSNLCKPIKTR